MRFAKISGTVGLVAGAALLLGACDGGSKAKAGGPAPTAPAAAATSSPGAAANPETPTGPDGGKYLAGFLAPEAFEPGLAAVTGYPNWDNGDVGDVHGLASLDCYSLENGGEASGSTMQAYQTMMSQGPNQDFATQKAYTFATGDAVKMMQYMELRFGADCKAFDHTPTDGTPKIHSTVAVQEVPGLGDQALALSASDQPDGKAAVTFDALLVRYGDTVIYVSFSNASADKVKAFDLASREKEIAKNLKLG